MREIMLTLLILLVYSVYNVTAHCKILTYTPPSLFKFAQQIFWDPRTSSIYFADAGAYAKGSPSIFRFDWKSRKWYSASVKNADTTRVSFIVPASSSSNTLIAGQSPCITRLYWDGCSSTATRIDDIACRNKPADLNAFDRGATSPKGTLYMSIIPSTLCNKTVASTYPTVAIEYLASDSCSASIKNALTPGTYSNGIVFDSKTNISYIAEDCSASVIAYRWNPTDNSLTYLKPVFRFPCDQSITNYPSGLVIDQCSNLYVGDHNSGRVYYVNSKTGKLIKKYTVPGSRVTAVGIVGPNLDYLCVMTGITYHDIYNHSQQLNSTDPGDGKMYLIPICSECSGHNCKGRPSVPVAGY